jgi:nucleotide-binding universal stress UspA family protein
MYDRILVPTDGSESMTTVYDHAADVASRRGATVHALYVLDDRAFLTLEEGTKDDVIEEFTEEGASATATAAARFAEDGVETAEVVRRGNPSEEVIDYVDEAGIDLVVMGTHGTDHQRSLLGSVSRSVTASSPVPVLTVNVADPA